MAVDVHAHLYPLGLPDLARATGDGRWPTLQRDGGRGSIVVNGRVAREIDDLYWSVPRRLELMDRWGITVQVLSPLPLLLPTWSSAGPDGDSAALWCRAVNRGIADAVAAGGGRLLGLGALPVHDLELAGAELAHVRALGLVGVELATEVAGGRTLSDPSLDAVFALLAEQHVPVLVHPVRRGLLGGIPGALEAAVTLPIDTTAALLPRLWPPNETALPAMCVSHGGGTVPWSWPRIRTLAGTPDARLPPCFHVDTAALEHRQIEFVVAELGADRVLFGSDCPATSATAVRTQLANLARLGPDVTAVLSSNAERLFRSSL